MRRAKAAAALLAFACVASVMVAFWLKVMHVLGWDGQTSDYYAAWSSSIGPMLTLVGMSTLIAGLWAHVNCHEPGCWYIGKHKVNGTPWCSRHHENARPERSVIEVLESIEATLASLRQPDAP